MMMFRTSDGPINSQEYKSSDIGAITIKISMTEYHHLIDRQTYGLFYGDNHDMVNPVTCLISLLSNT